MLAPQDVSIYLNNALKASHLMAELDRENALPEIVREMPDDVSGRLLVPDASAAQEIAAAWKKVMILNRTEVLYTFTFEVETGKFSAKKR